MMPKPLCIDLFCGYGGWARGFLDAGYWVIGFDNDPKCAKRYPGEFVLEDIRDFDGRAFPTPRVIVASPPCNFYSKLSLPQSWNRGWKEDDGGELWNEAERIIERVKPWFWCIENVRGAEKIHGKSKMRVGSRYLWGEFPIMNPKPIYGKWRLPPSKDRTATSSPRR